MREIKFRGKRPGSGNWAYGYLVNQLYINIGNPYSHIFIENHCLIRIDPATVGQFTGLHDKNGKEIYEGDICTHGRDTGEIVWLEEYATFGLRICAGDGRVSVDTYPIPMYYDPEVIGSIHDNPELLKTE